MAETAIALKSNAQNWLPEPKKLFIGGKWVDAISGKTFDVLDPSTGKVIAAVAAGEKEDIDLAVKAARKAFDGEKWSGMTTSQRGLVIHKIGDLILENVAEFAELESLDNGKPITISTAADVPLSADLFHYMSGWATKIEGNTIPISTSGIYAPGTNFLSYTLREPVGVIGQIIPWNFPLLMAAWKLGPVLATGNCVVLKPAPQTPLTAIRLAEIMQEAGIPDGVVNVVTGGDDTGAAISAHDGIDKVAFTGSTEVGKKIIQAAAGNLKKVTLELGGKSPNIIFPDADLDSAIPGAASAIFFNHGQCCCAGSRLYAGKKVFDQVLEGVSKAAEGIKLGPGLDPNTEMGPLVSDEQFDKVKGYLESGKKEGATCTVGGEAQDGDGYFVRPTVFTDTKPSMKIIKEEIFGPVVAVESFEDDEIEKIIKEANNTNYGLAAGIWTSNLATAHSTAAKLRSGTVWINCYNIFDAALPFGGYKQSGWGREMGHEILDAYTETKAVTLVT